MTIVKNTLRILTAFGCTFVIICESRGQVYSYLEDVILDSPPAPTPGMAPINNKFPKISFSETQPKVADRLAKYNLVVFRGNANKTQLAIDTKAINPDLIAIKYTHPVEYIANSNAPQEFPFTGSGPVSNGTGKVYAGHWLYKAGKRTTSSMTASSNTVTVNNSGGLNAGKYVVIYDPPVGSFKNAEQALIGSKSGNTITFSTRGYKSTAKSHPSNAIIALHDLGQGGAEENWRYNMSTECPLDGSGKKMNQVMAEWQGANLLLDDYPNGTPRPDIFDGIEFDADQNSVPGTDANNDLQVDDGYVGTQNVWVNGVETFYQLLRNQHPDKYIIGGAHNTMGFDILNGNQLESWPSGGSFQNSPAYDNMDGYMSRLQYQLRYRQIGPIYMECLSKTPSPSYPDPQPKGNGPQNHKAHRFQFGLALLDDGFYVEARHGNGPDMNLHYPNGIQDFWYDEYSVDVTSPIGSANYGKSIHGKTGNQTQLRNHSQWLGTASGPRQRIYDNTFAPANNMISNGTFDANKNGWSATNVTTSRVTNQVYQGSGSLRASTMNNFNSNAFGATIKSQTFSVTNGQEYTVCFAFRASEYREFNVKVGNQMSKQPKFNAGPHWARHVLTFKATSTKSNERVTIGVGGHDTEVWLDEFYVFQGNANVFRRDFENGIVVVNATHSTKTIQLGEMFKRIDGHLDPENDGLESSSITLQKFDSAVFVRLSGGGGGTGGVPNAPSNMASTAMSDTQIDLAWADNATNEDEFKLQRKIGTGSYVLIATLPANTTSYADTGLTANTSCTYRIRAKNGAGFSTFSNTTTATTTSGGPTVPNAPTSLAATTVSDTAIDVTWVDASNNEDDFKLQRKTGAGSYVLIATLPANATSFSDTGLTADTTYTYRIRARNGAGYSVFSNTANATTATPPPAIPNAPTGMTATTISDVQIDLTWTDNASNEDEFKLQRKTDTGTFALIATLPANTTSFSDTGLLPNTNYHYRIRARNGAGFSTFSNTATATTASPPPAIPNAPSSLSAVAVSNNQINVSWIDASNNEDEFKLQRKTGAGSYVLIATLPPNTTSYSDSGLGFETHTYRIRARNAAGFSSFSNTSTVTLANTAPTLSSIADQSVDENSSIVVNLSASDADLDPIGLSAIGLPLWGNLVDNGDGTGTISLSPSSGDAGSYTVTVTANDGNGGSSSDAFVVTVNTVVPNAPSSLSAVAVSNSQINITWVDTSNDEDEFRLQRKTEIGNYELAAILPANTTSYSDLGLASDTYTYRIRAKNAGGYSSFSNTSTVALANTAPALTAIADQSVDENSSIVVNLSASDADLDPIGLSATGLPPWGSLVDNGDGTGTITLSPGYEDSGIYNVTVTADDGNGGTANDGFAITVNDVNQAPVLTAIVDQSVDESSSIVVNLSASDADLDLIALSATGLPPWGSLVDNGDGTGTISLSPGYEDSGIYNVTVTADDGNGGTASDGFAITVNDVNQVPVLTAIADQSVDENSSIVVNLSASDADLDPITLSATGLPLWGSLVDNGDGTGTISLSPGYEDSGIYNVTVTADDGNGGTASDGFAITVNDVNQVPVLTAIADQSVDENSSIVVSLSASDADLDPITLSATGLPLWGSLVDNGDGTGTISLSPGDEDSGIYNVTVTADDGNGGTASDGFAITVNNMNQAPTLTSIVDQSVDENSSIVVSLSASDADLDPITLSATGLPLWGSLVDNGDGTGTISLSPGYEDSGIYNVTVTADDGNGGTASDGFAVTVNDVNRTPVLTSIADQSVDENSSLVVSLSASDADLDPIVLSAVNLPMWGSLTDNGNGTGSLSFLPGVTDSGIYSITVNADDGTASDSTSFTLTVNNMNQAPSISLIADQNVDENSSIQVNLSATDPDAEDLLVFSTTGLPAFATLTDNGNGTGVIDISPLSNDSGIYTITVTVDDGNSSQNTDSDSFVLTVNGGGFYYENDFSVAGSVNTDFGENLADWTCDGTKLIRATTKKFKRLNLTTPGADVLTDYMCEVDMKTNAPNGGLNTAAVMVRYVSKLQFYQVQIDANGDLVVRKKNGSGNWTLLGETTDQRYAPMANRNFRLAVDVYGNSSTTIDVYVDEETTPSLSVTDTNAPYLQGPPAFETKKAWDVDFDNMLVYE